MDFLATKTHGENEDDEAKRLVRPQPKNKPPRRDRRRDDMQPDRDPDVEGDPDTKSDPDKSLNYKNVGGSADLIARVVLGFKEAKSNPKFQQRKKEKKRDKRQDALSKRPKPKQTGPAKYVSVSDAEQGGKTVSVTEQAAKNNPSRYKLVKDEEKKEEKPSGKGPEEKKEPEKEEAFKPELSDEGVDTHAFALGDAKTWGEYNEALKAFRDARSESNVLPGALRRIRKIHERKLLELGPRPPPAGEEPNGKPKDAPKDEPSGKPAPKPLLKSEDLAPHVEALEKAKTREEFDAASKAFGEARSGFDVSPEDMKRVREIYVRRQGELGPRPEKPPTEEPKQAPEKDEKSKGEPESAPKKRDKFNPEPKAPYEPIKELDARIGGEELQERAKTDPALKSAIGTFSNPASALQAIADSNPGKPVKEVFPKAEFPPEIKTLGDLKKALELVPDPVAKAKRTKRPTPEAGADKPTPEGEKAPTGTPEEAPETAAAKKKEEAEAAKKKKEEAEAAQPKSAQEFEPPKRPEPTKQQRLEAANILYAMKPPLPPSVRTEMLLLHPDDAKAVMAKYTQFNTLEAPKSVQGEIEAAKASYLTSPSQVTSLPKKGTRKKKNDDGTEEVEEIPFKDLSDDEKKVAVQAHRMDVMAASLASRVRVTNALKLDGVPEHLAPGLAHFTLSSASLPAAEKEAKAKAVAADLFAKSSSGYSKEEEDKGGRFGQVVRKITRPFLKDEGREKFISSIKKLDPAAQVVAVGALQGEDYRSAVDNFLKNPKSKDNISERDTPEEMARKLTKATDTLRKAGKKYPSEARSALEDPAAVFRVDVRKRLMNLDPAKAAKLSEILRKNEDETYEKDLEDHKEVLSGHKEKVRDYKEEYREWKKGKAQHEKENGDDPYRSKPFETPEPQPPVTPKPPTQPIGYQSSHKPPKAEREATQQELDELRQPRVASLYSSYWNRNWQMGPTTLSMADARQAVRTAIYHGVEPYPKGHEGFAPYPKWNQVHQCDLGPSDFETLLTAAKGWLKSPVLSKSVEGMVPDARFRAALDLAISNAADGKYNRAIQAPLYNMMLAKLAGQPSEETLLTVHTAGFGYGVDTITVLFVPTRKPVPFNIDTINAINKTWIPTEGDDGEEHDVNLRVVDTRGGGFLTFHQEKDGLRVETLVWVQVPKADIDKAFKALQDVGKKFGFKVEKATSGTKPGVRKTSSTEETEGNAMTVKFAKEQANVILDRLDKVAGYIQANHEKWGMDFESAKNIVNDLDRTADDIEKAAYGDDSLAHRQVEVLKSAKVIQQDSDEKYMGTYNAPMAPKQTDSDEPYMGQYKDDQSQSVQTGKAENGRSLAP